MASLGHNWLLECGHYKAGNTFEISQWHQMNFITSQINWNTIIWLLVQVIIKSELWNTSPDGKIHGANMGLIRGRKVPGGPHVGPMNLAIWELWEGNPQIIVTKDQLWESGWLISYTLNSITFSTVEAPFRNFAQSTTIWLKCYVVNSRKKVAKQEHYNRQTSLVILRWACDGYDI